MKMKFLKKSNIASLLIVALVLCGQSSFAGNFYEENGVKKYIDDNGNLATGWRWIDANGDNIAECYRFNKDGSLVATNTTIKGKDVNKDGMWVVDGVVQKIYKSTGLPLYFSNAALGEKDTNEYFDLGTYSSAKRINATKKENLKDLIEADLRKDTEDYLNSLIGPKDEYERPEEGYLLSKGVKTLDKKRPVATASNRYIIDDALKEDEIKYVSATTSIVAGRDMRSFVSASNKYTAKADGVKIWGGEVWDDVIVLQGNGAYVKFSTTDNSKRYKANYFTCEIAHQTHGESTADTYCGIELYLNGKSVEVYDEFCDGKPELLQEYLDDGEKTVELRAIVTGDAPGRKIYIRNARFRQLSTFIGIEDPEERKAAMAEAREEKKQLAEERKAQREAQKKAKAEKKNATTKK